MLENNPFQKNSLKLPSTNTYTNNKDTRYSNGALNNLTY